MEVDSGASRSTVSQYVYNTLLTDFPLQNTDVTLPSYSGEKVPILGKVSVPVKYSSSDDTVLDLIVDGSFQVCGDYKALNERSDDDSYKLPYVQDIFAVLSQDGSTPDTFSIIDLASAFNQLFLDDESSECY